MLTRRTGHTRLSELGAGEEHVAPVVEAVGAHPALGNTPDPPDEAELTRVRASGSLSGSIDAMAGPLDGKVAVVTGASSGIGEATALALARAGAAVALGARRKDRLDALAERISGEGGRAHVRAVDLTDEADAARLHPGGARRARRARTSW